MRVFCPEHKRGFFAPRQSPVKCENRGHLLGELDFEGVGNSPVEIRWQYCCNCEHFCPIDFDREGLERCPVCTRPSSQLYLCDKCHLVSFESNTPLELTPVTPDKDGALRFAFDVSLGVRKKDHELRDQLDMFVTNHRKEINGILDGYNVPRVAPEAQLTSAK